MHLDRPRRIPGRSNGKKGDDQRVSDTPCHPDIEVVATKQHGVGVKEQIKTEERCQPQAQRLDCPARVRRSTAKEALDQDQSDYGQPDSHRVNDHTGSVAKHAA